MNAGKNTQLGHKKVFDVVRPGKSMAGANSRPMISSHKPAVTDGQLVGIAGQSVRERAANPRDRRGLMSPAQKISFHTTSDDDTSAAHAQGLPPKTPLSAQPAPPQPVPQPEPVADQPRKPGFIEITSDEDNEKIGVTVGTTPQPAQPAKLPDQPVLSGVDDLLLDEDDLKDDTSEHHDLPAEPTQPPLSSMEITADPEPEPAPALPQAPSPEPKAAADLPIAPDAAEDPLLADFDTKPADDQPPKESPQPSEEKPDHSKQVDPKATLSHTEIMAGAGMTMTMAEEQEAGRPIVSHHKSGMRWWHWLLVVFFVLLIGLAAFDFLLDAEIITTDLSIPYTNFL